MRDRASIAKKHRAALEPQLAAIARAAKVADDHATMTFDWPTGPAAPDFRERGDAIVVMRDDVDQREAAVQLGRLDDDPYRVARAFLDGTGVLKYPKLTVYEPLLAQVEHARHALIVVTREASPAFQDGAGRFTAGKVDAVALLVELASAALRGGFDVRASSSGEVGSKPGLMEVALRDDLESQFRRAIARGLRQRFADATPPDGYEF